MTGRTVSVVVCTDGRLPFLKTTLQGLAALDYAVFEICLVLGPTDDGARAFAETLSGRVKIAHCPERNLSRARNLGIGLAAGEIVAFLDDDAVPEPEWLADLDAAYNDPAIVAAGGVVYDSAGVAFQARYVTVDRLGYARPHGSAPTPRLNYPYAPEIPHLLGANCSFRRETLVALGGFDEEYEYFLDETDLQMRVVDAGGAIAQCRRAAVHHKSAPSVDRRGDRIIRRWRPLIKNRLYFGLRNGALHHSFWEILRAAENDAAQWRKNVAASVDRGELTRRDLARFDAEAEDGFLAGLAAARAPQRRLMNRQARVAPPPPFLPFTATASKRLLLCLVSQDYPPRENGGIARNVAELARAWGLARHYVHVFTRARGPASLDFEDGVWVHRVEIGPAEPAPDLISPHRIPQPLWDFSSAMFTQVAALDRRRRVDLVYAPLWDGEAAAFVHEPRWPLVCALQTTMDFWLDSQPERRRDPDWMRARGAPLLALEGWILAQAPLLHANSRAIVEDIAPRYRQNFAADRLICAPHGLPDWAAAAPPPEPAEGVRFLFVGRLESRKGIDVLLAAAPDVLRRFRQARLDIVGDDAIVNADGRTYRASFEARDDAADLAGRIVFHGRVEEAALRAHYRGCDVLVAPSRYESFGLVYVEGMMFGKPVIGGRAGGGAEVIGGAGLLVAPGDVEALAAAMSRLADDPALRREMGEAGRRRYEAHFRAEAAAKTLLEGALAQLAAKTALTTAT